MLQMAKVLRTRYSTLSISKAVTRLRAAGESVTGHSDVLLAQIQVKQCKDTLKTWRKGLAEATQSYEDIQRKLKSLYTRKTHVYQDQRRDLSVLQAINDEEESLLFEEQNLSLRVEECKRGERESFDSLSDAIQDSHEKERAQAERMKYYTRIASLIGAFFGFLGSNFFIKREIRNHNASQSLRLERIEESMSDFQSDKQASIRPGTLLQVAGDTKTLIQLLEKLKKQSSLTDDTLNRMSSKIERFSKQLENNRIQNRSTPNLEDSAAKTNSISKKTDVVMLGSVVSYSLLLALFALV